jgi:predicted small secreted protein
MRMKILIISLLLSIASFVIAGCSNNVVSLGEEFSLRMSESAVIKGEELQIKFVDVSEDSRCPTGVVCVWEGRVICLIEITYRGSLHRVVLSEPGSTSWPPENVFEEYKIAYHVEPYPQAGAKIEKEEYSLELAISK